MPILYDDTQFDRIAPEFVIRFAESMARLLHRSDLVDFSYDTVDEDRLNLLFDLCFFAIAQLEEQSGFPVGTTTYTPRAVFETDGGGSEPTLLIGTTKVHGLVETEALLEGIERARRPPGH